MLLFEGRVGLFSVHNLLLIEIVGYVTEVAAQRSLEHIAGGVGQVVGQLQLVVQALVARGEVVAPNGIDRPVVQVVVGRFLRPQVAVVLVTDAVVQRQLTLSRVPFAIHRVVALAGRQRLGERGAQRVSVVCPSGSDFDDVGNAVAVAHAGVVDEMNVTDALRVERKHLRLVHDDAVDADLHASPLVDGRDGVSHLVHTDIREGELLEQAVARAGRSLLLFGGIEQHSVGLLDNPVGLDLHLAQFHGRFHLLREGGEGQQQKEEDGPESGDGQRKPASGSLLEK